MSDSQNDFPMLDLYQQEVSTHCETLNEGLRQLESETVADAALFEVLIRAAHSMKGAARIVGIQPVGDVAQGLEAFLTQAEADHWHLGLNHREVFLQVLDLWMASAQQSVSEMALWLESAKETAEALLTQIQGLELGDVSEVVTEAGGASLPNTKTVSDSSNLERQDTASSEALNHRVPTVSKPTTPVQGSLSIDASILDLFRKESREQLATLSSGLVTLENDPSNPELIESLMRAAHSMKGIVRIVRLSPAVEVTHAMEDAFVAVQKGQVSLSPEGIDVLLQVTDWLSGLADEDLGTWAQNHAGEVGAFCQKLEALAQGKALPMSLAPLPKPSTEAKHSASKSSVAGRVALEPSQANEVGSTGTTDGVVRVSAENLNRLMGLAAETLVETRRLEPFRESLLRLKESQMSLNHRIDAAQHSLGRVCLDPVVAAQMEALRPTSRAHLESIRQQIDAFDSFSREHSLLSDRLYREMLESRMRPFRDGVLGFPRLVRDMARALGKKIHFELTGKETRVDRDILDKLDLPLNHILRNACCHGLESPEERLAQGKEAAGKLSLGARHSAGMLVVEIRDDGRGVDVACVREKILELDLCPETMLADMGEAEVLEFLFLPGFSTATEVTEISGRGVGLDVVQTAVQDIGGKVRVDSELHWGTQFTIEVPITRSVVRALIGEIDGEPYAFPLNRIIRTLKLHPQEIRVVENCQYFTMDGVNVGLVAARTALGITHRETALPKEFTVVVVSDRKHLYGVEIDRFMGEVDLVVRPLDKRLGQVPGISAASLTEEGDPLLIIDVEDLVQSIDKLLSGGVILQTERRDASASACRKKQVLVVDDSITVRETERQLLENAGYTVEVAVDGIDGWNAIRLGAFDLVVTDIDMPRLNGFELVKKIRDDNRLGRIPVVIVSYKDREADRMKGLEAGADFYLTKSAFQDDTFIQAVDELIGAAEEAVDLGQTAQ